MTTTTHSNCDHPATKAARAACRKARTQVDPKAAALVQYFDITCSSDSSDWLLKGARRFDATDRYHAGEGVARNIDPTDRYALAASLLNYFFPADREARADWYLLFGYTITSDPTTIRRIILRAFS